MNYKYYVIYTSNGNLQLDKITEYSDITKAIVAFHDKCKALWNEPTVVEAIVEIIYSENLAVVTHEGKTYSEKITHAPVSSQQTENTGA